MTDRDPLAARLRAEHQRHMVRCAELIRDWRPGAERNEHALIHVRQALLETPARISEATRSRIYGILRFILPSDGWRAGDQTPDEVLVEQAAIERTYQWQLEQRSCPECGEGMCPGK